MSIRVREVIREWMEGEERHRVVEWSDNSFSRQRIFVEGGLPRWENIPMPAEDVWGLFPETAPGWFQQRLWEQRQEARRRKVWWRRILREAGWR